MGSFDSKCRICVTVSSQRDKIRPMTRIQKAAVAAALLLAILLVPIPYLAAPEWRVRVTDEAGAPLAGMRVRLSYQNYSVENEAHVIEQISDANGTASFPVVYSSASLLGRIYFTSRSAAALAHGSFGPHDWVTVFGQGRVGYADSNGSILNWTGKPEHVNSTIVAKPATR